MKLSAYSPLLTLMLSLPNSSAFTNPTNFPSHQCSKHTTLNDLNHLKVAKLTVGTRLHSEQVMYDTKEARDVETLPLNENISSTTIETVTKKNYLDDGFVFGLSGSGLDRPKGKVPQIVIDGDSLETKPYQVAMVATTLLSHSIFALYDMIQITAATQGNLLLSATQIIVTLLSSWILADLGSGILHWSVDNYGNGRTPIMGGIIAAFQGHHTAPWTITARGFSNNVHKLCIPFGIPTVALITALAGPSRPLVALFFTFFCTFEIMSQEFHKWSHMTKGEATPFINFLQKYNLTIGRKPHALHHTQPFEGNYCIISGICNKFLDDSGFFRRLEHIVYKLNGVESNAWKLDEDLKMRTLRGEYGLR